MSERARPGDFWQLIRAELDRARDAVRPKRMQVASLSSGRVVVKDAGTGDVHDEDLARIAGLKLAVDDFVLVDEDLGVVLGKLQNSAPGVLEMDAPLIGQVYVNVVDGSSAETASSGDLVNYVTAVSMGAWSLPAGTYRVTAHGSLLAAHSASGNVALRVVAGGVAGGAVSLPVETTIPAVTRIATAAAVTVDHPGGSLAATLQYRPGATGIAYARNPVLMCWAIRTS